MEILTDLENLSIQAAAAFSKEVGCSSVFANARVVKSSSRCLVVRMDVTSDMGVRSLILKKSSDQSICGINDWASIEFLSATPEAQKVVPKYYGGDAAHGFFLIEDLGMGESFHDVLSRGEPETVFSSIRMMAYQMARLHSVSSAAESEFESLRFSLSGANPLQRHQEGMVWLANRVKVLNWFKALDCVIPLDFESKLEEVAARYQSPGELLAFTHGDPAPTNNHFSARGMKLLDFEYGSFRHVLYDLSAWNVLCPLPRPLLHEMMHCFREEVGKYFPTLRNEMEFQREWFSICAYRAWAILSWISPDVIFCNRLWADNWGMRETVYVALSRLKEMAEGPAGNEVMSEATGNLLKSLRCHWPNFEDADHLLPSWNS